MKGQWCYIYENKGLGNSSNGGVSSTHKEVFVVGIAEEKLKYPKDSEGIPIELIMTISHGHRGYKSLEPLHTPSGVIGPMAGGSIVCMDLEEGREYLPLHDRFETQEMYDRLCR